MSNIPEYLFPIKTHTHSSLNTLQHPISGLLTPHDSLTTANSPERTHIVSRATSAETKVEIHHTVKEGSPLSHLFTLLSVASYVNPASVSPENILDLTFDLETPVSPLILPSHAQSDPVYTSVPQPQEEGATFSSTLLSPLYHVQSPSPTLAPPSIQTSLVTHHSSTPLPQPSPSVAVA